MIDPELPNIDNTVGMVDKALRHAWSLGQEYWYQADSESYSQNRKSHVTRKMFDLLIEKTIADLEVQLCAYVAAIGGKIK